MSAVWVVSGAFRRTAVAGSSRCCRSRHRRWRRASLGARIVRTPRSPSEAGRSGLAWSCCCRRASRDAAALAPAAVDRRHTVADADRVPWRDVPERYGSWGRVYDLFRRWQRDGTWKRLFAELQAQADAKQLPASAWNGWVTVTEPKAFLDDAALCRDRWQATRSFPRLRCPSASSRGRTTRRPNRSARGRTTPSAIRGPSPAQGPRSCEELDGSG